MINSKRDLKYYIDCDLKSIGIYPLRFKHHLIAIMCPQPWKLQIIMRHLEYRINCKSNTIIGKCFMMLEYKRFERYCLKLGCSLAVNVFGPGLCLNHCNGVVVNGQARIGSNVRINAGVNIGSFSKFDQEFTHYNAPVMGNNVYIGPGAKIFGKIHIGDNVAIGANAVVNKDVPSNSTAVGVPARILANHGSFNMVKYGDANVAPKNMEV